MRCVCRFLTKAISYEYQSEFWSRRQMKLKFADMNSLLEPLLDSLGAGIYAVDVNRKITDWNRQAEVVAGYTAAETIGRDCAEVLYVATEGGTNICQNRCPMLRSFASKCAIDCPSPDVYFIHKTGRKIPTRSTVCPVLDDSGNLLGGVKLFMDISEEKELQHKVQMVADTDELTGLYNRRLFFGHIQREIYGSDRYGHPLSLLFLDIDDFKSYNDQYGHSEGDRVITSVAHILYNESRKTDTCYRMGGEEFAVLLPNTDLREACSVAERIRNRVVSSPFRPGEDGQCAVFKTVSIGAAEWKSGVTDTKLLNLADQAMYEAKNHGKNRICT